MARPSSVMYGIIYPFGIVDCPAYGPIIGHIDYSSFYTQRLCSIRDYLFTNLHNEEFSHIIRGDLETKLDYMYESSETQNGKTKIILTATWYLKFFCSRIPVILTDNSNVDIMQLIDRAREFDNDICRHLEQNGLGDLSNRCILDLKEIKASTQPDIIASWIRDNNNAFITSTHPERYNKLHILAERSSNIPLAFIYDEADMTVGPMKTSKEQIHISLMAHYGERIKNIYITATAFAVMNSDGRTELRNLTHRKLPNNLYPGLEYRGYYHSSVTHIMADWVPALKTDGWSAETIEGMISCLRQIRDTRYPSQPCITLINVANDNSVKHAFARVLSYMLSQISCHIIVYTGDGIDVYNRDGDIIKKYETYIGAYLQMMKDSGYNDPIFIISTRKASRSQTYKSRDNGWKLTHFILDLPKTSHVESVIQSLRANGQYRSTNPPLMMWMTYDTHKLIHNSLMNKEILTGHFSMNSRSHRSVITTTPLLKKAPPMTRREILDVKMNRSSNGHLECETLQQAVHYAEWYRDRYCSPDMRIIQITDLHTIPMSDFISEFPEIDITQDAPFVGLHTQVGLQTRIRDYVHNIARQRFGYNSDHPTLQIAYSEARENMLNKIDFKKGDNYCADIIALSPGNKLTVPIVIYRSRVFLPQAIYIWHGTDSKVRVYVKGERSDQEEFGLLQQKNYLLHQLLLTNIYMTFRHIYYIYFIFQ